MRRLMSRWHMLWLTAATLLATACIGEPVEGHTITSAALLERLSSDSVPFILDVRSPAEYHRGHVPGAVNIPHRQVAARLNELPSAKSSDIVVYCEAGPRAEYAASVLRQSGFTHVLHLEGDMEGWRRAHLQVDVQ